MNVYLLTFIQSVKVHDVNLKVYNFNWFWVLKFKEFSGIEENELSKDVKFASEMNQAPEPTLLDLLLLFLNCIDLYKKS